MNTDLAQLQSLLKTQQRTALYAAMADSLIVGSLTFVLALAILIALKFPLALAVVPAAFASFITWRRPAPLGRIATVLDRRHGLADLLSSAWAVRESDEPWAASLRLMADAKAAALPASPWPGRWTVRRSACGLAMAGVALLLTQLVPNSLARAETKTTPTADASGAARPVNSQRIADARQRPADTATSETRLPSEHESAANGQSRSDPAQSAANDGNGDGHADSKQGSSIELRSSAKGVTHPSDAVGGNSIATGRNGNAGATGVVKSKPRDLTEATIDLGRTPPNISAESRPATPPPAGYHDLISDFFDR